MTSLKVCLMCLATDVKLNYFEGLLEAQAISLLGYKSTCKPGAPQYACYKCTWMIRKFARVKEKYFIAQSTLNKLLEKDKYISEEDLKQIDRKTLHLESNISIHKLPCIDVKREIEDDVPNENILLDMSVEEDANESSKSASYFYEDDKPLCEFFKDKHHKKKKEKGKEDHRLRKERRLRKLKVIVGELDNLQIDDNKLQDFVIAKLSLPEQLAELEKRKESSNYKDLPYRCDICYKGFLQIETLNNHSVKHDISSGKLVCEVCKFRFHERRAYSLHVSRHAQKFSCTRCNFVTVHSDKAKKHKQWHDGVTYKCQHCNVVSSKLTSHLSHIRMKHTSRFVCEACGFSFVSDKGLKMHRTRMHKGLLQEKKSNIVEEKDLFCKDCDLQFLTAEAWKRHRVNSAVHRDKLGASCRVCGDTFASASRLRAHARAHAGARGVLRARAQLARRRYVPRRTRARDSPAATARLYPATCEHCPEPILNRSHHWKHYQRCHQDQKYPLSDNKYICEYCGKGFQANAFLVYHKRTHFNERLYQCGACRKRFHTGGTLRAHQRTHCAAGQYACTLCCKTFKTKLGLQQHGKSHSGYRPFSCSHCSKSFTRASCLTMHLNRIHLE